VPQQPRGGRDGLDGGVSKIDNRKPSRKVKKKKFQVNLGEKLLARDHGR